MTIKERNKRNLRILDYLQNHTAFEAALKFNLSLHQIFVIKKKVKGINETPAT